MGKVVVAGLCLGARHSAALVVRGKASGEVSLSLIDDPFEVGEGRGGGEEGGAGPGGSQRGLEDGIALGITSTTGAISAATTTTTGTSSSAGTATSSAGLPPFLQRLRWKYLTIRRKAFVYGMAQKKRGVAWIPRDADDAEFGKQLAAQRIQRVWRVWRYGGVTA